MLVGNIPVCFVCCTALERNPGGSDTRPPAVFCFRYLFRRFCCVNKHKCHRVLTRSFYTLHHSEALQKEHACSSHCRSCRKAASHCRTSVGSLQEVCRSLHRHNGTLLNLVHCRYHRVNRFSFPSQELKHSNDGAPPMYFCR